MTVPLGPPESLQGMSHPVATAIPWTTAVQTTCKKPRSQTCSPTHSGPRPGPSVRPPLGNEGKTSLGIALPVAYGRTARRGYPRTFLSSGSGQVLGLSTASWCQTTGRARGCYSRRRRLRRRSASLVLPDFYVFFSDIYCGQLVFFLET